MGAIYSEIRRSGSIPVGSIFSDFLHRVQLQSFRIGILNHESPFKLREGIIRSDSGVVLLRGPGVAAPQGSRDRFDLDPAILRHLREGGPEHRECKMASEAADDRIRPRIVSAVRTAHAA